MTEIPLEQHVAPSGERMTVRDLASCPRRNDGKIGWSMTRRHGRAR